MIPRLLHELAYECIESNEYFEHPDRNSVNYKQLEDDTILCVHHTGNGQFRCRVAPGDDKHLMLATLIDHMDDVYATTRFNTPLAPPYTLDEIEKFEQENETTIPALLRHYLLKISRETVCDLYRVTVDLAVRGLTCNRVATPDIVSGGVLVETYEYSDITDNPIELEGTLEFSDGGCAFTSYVIVKGEGHGHVLRYDGNSTYFIEPLWKHLLNPHVS